MDTTMFNDAGLVEDTRDERSLMHAWCAEQLRRLGVSHILAETFADLVDWHDLETLVARGCPPNLALDIVR
jgi:hypothetical protein